MAAERPVKRVPSRAARKKAEPEIVPLVAHRSTDGAPRPWMKRWLDSFLHE